MECYSDRSKRLSMPAINFLLTAEGHWGDRTRSEGLRIVHSTLAGYGFGYGRHRAMWTNGQRTTKTEVRVHSRRAQPHTCVQAQSSTVHTSFSSTVCMCWLLCDTYVLAAANKTKKWRALYSLHTRRVHTNIFRVDSFRIYTYSTYFRRIKCC
jgi:hypothetical protein